MTCAVDIGAVRASAGTSSGSAYPRSIRPRARPRRRSSSRFALMTPLSPVRILVTGGAGFIGSHYVRTLLSGGYPGYENADVTVFDKLTYAGNLANLAPVVDSPRYRFEHGDICVPSDLDHALPGHDLIVNFAAESHVDRSIGGAASDFVTTNVLGAQQ